MSKKSFLTRNSSQNQAASQPITNLQGGVGYHITNEEKLVEVFTLGLLQGNYYESEKEVFERIMPVLQNALNNPKQAELATKAAVYAAEVMGMKFVPTLWVAMLSTLEDKTLFKAAFPRVITNPKLAHDFADLCRKSNLRKGMGQAVKKVINKWLYDKLNAYWACRYTGKLEDLMHLSHPVPFSGVIDSARKTELKGYFDYIFRPAVKSTKGENDKFSISYGPRRLTFARAQALEETVQALNEGRVDEAVMNNIKTHKLQMEELKHTFGKLSSEQLKAVYMYFVPGLQYNALTSNLVAIERAFATNTREVMKADPMGSGKMFKQKEVLSTNVPAELKKIVAEKLADYAAYRKSKMLVFGLITAHGMCITAEWKNALNKVMRQAGKNAFEAVQGVKVRVGADTSGSMHSHVTPSLMAVDIAAYFGASVALSIPGSNCYATATHSKYVPMTGEDLVDNASRIIRTDVGAGTYFESLLQGYNGENYVILITDGMQADNLERAWANLAGRPQGSKLIIWYVTGHFTHVSNRDDILHVKGFSDQVLNLIRNVIEGKGSQLDLVKAVQL